MRLEIFAVFDSAAAAYLPPFFTHNEQLATRSFIDTSNNPETSFFRHPADFTLFRLGYFDDQKAEFELLSAPQKIANALELKAHEEQQSELFNEISNVQASLGRSQGEHTQEQL